MIPIVRTFRPDPSDYVWTFGGAPPLARVAPGTILELFTEDCFAGHVKGVDDLVSEVCEFPYVNPQTGPFYVEGAEPGDTLAVHFVSIKPARDWAVSTTVPLFGALTSTHLTATLQDPLPEVVWIWQLDRSRDLCRFESRFGDWQVDLPMVPMHGTVGVAPANLEVRSSLVPDAHGGNLDTPEMRAGVTCYLGVNVEGAMFSIGDGHARQGEGETCGVAAECAMDTVLVVDLIKGTPCPWPRLESDSHIITHRLDAAARGRLPDRPDRPRAVVGERLRIRHARRVSVRLSSSRVAAGERRRHQLHLGREGTEGVAARPSRHAGHARPHDRAGRGLPERAHLTPSMWSRVRRHALVELGEVEHRAARLGGRRSARVRSGSAMAPDRSICAPKQASTGTRYRRLGARRVVPAGLLGGEGSGGPAAGAGNRRWCLGQLLDPRAHVGAGGDEGLEFGGGQAIEKLGGRGMDRRQHGVDEIPAGVGERDQRLASVARMWLSPDVATASEGVEQ